MPILDIFDNDAFKQATLIDGIERSEYQPDGLINYFTPVPIRTEDVAIETRGNTLSLVPFSQRGTPAMQPNLRDRRNIRKFGTARLSTGDRIMASELDFIRRFNTETQVQQLADEIAIRLGGRGRAGLLNNMDLTFEHMALNCLRGQFVDADGSVLYDWGTELGGTGTGVPYIIPTETFDFSALINGDLRDKLTKLSRSVARNSEGSWNPRVKFVALAGDDFFDEMIKNAEIRDTYKYVTGGSEQVPVTHKGTTIADGFGTVKYHGLTVINYKGTDDNSTVAVAADEAHLFPVNIPDMFQHVMAHGESFSDLGKLGHKYYPDITRDLVKDRYVDLDVSSYPLLLCKYPRMLRKLKLV